MVGTLALALTACGDDSVDQDALESGMVPSRRRLPMSIRFVPGRRQPETGTEFECTRDQREGQEVPVTATITGHDGYDILFELETVDGVDVTSEGLTGVAG